MSTYAVLSGDRANFPIVLVNSKDSMRSRRRAVPIGSQFGRWTTLAKPRSRVRCGKYVRFVRCRCNCPAKTIKAVRVSNLVNGHSKGCGCKNREVLLNAVTRHGYARRGKVSPEYRAYCNAITRCTNPNRECWENYGGRGIEFRFDSFEQFMKEVGHRPSPQHTLDRWPNNDGHYEPGNVRWATRTQQALNKQRMVVQA